MINVEPLEIFILSSSAGEERSMVEHFQTDGWMNREKVEFE